MREPANANMVLIVDDDHEICEAMQLAINMEGFAVRVAHDIESALDIVAIESPSLIFLDYYGIGENLTRLVSDIRRLNVSVPIVLMTGAKEPGNKAKSLGLTYYLAKPFECDALRAIFQKHKISRRSSRRAKADFSLFS